MANKKFFTYDEQIEKLEKEKQLVISDPKFAKNTLQTLSYFSLIGDYKDLFKHKPSGNYLHDVTFEEITAFYYFDEELRTLFLKYILHVERQLKSMLSYYFCEKYGEQQTAYALWFRYYVHESYNHLFHRIHLLLYYLCNLRRI